MTGWNIKSVSEGELRSLYEEIDEYRSWHWKTDRRTGFFAHHLESRTTAHVLEVVRKLDHESSRNQDAGAVVDKLRDHLRKLYEKFRSIDDPLASEAADAISLVIGVVTEDSGNAYGRFLTEFRNYKRRALAADSHETLWKIKNHFALVWIQLWNGSDSLQGIKDVTNREVDSFKSQLLERKHNEWIRERLSDEEQRRGAEHYDIQEENIEKAKEEFFHYKTLIGRVIVPPELFDRDIRLAYDPFTLLYEPTPTWTCLFHGSESTILSTVVKFGKLASADELRILGTAKQTGESRYAGAVDPNFVSLSKSFPTSFSWGKNSRSRIPGYPIVFGVSRSVLSRAERRNGMKGEIYIPKNIPLGGQGITHIYMPQRTKEEVRSQLGSHTSQVTLVGLDDLPALPEIVPYRYAPPTTS